MGKCLASHAMLYQTAWMVGMDYGEAFRFSFNAPRQKAWAHLLLPLLREIYTLDYDGLEVSGTGTQSLERDYQSLRSLKEKLLALLTTIVWSCNHTYHGLNTSSLETCFLPTVRQFPTRHTSRSISSALNSPTQKTAWKRWSWKGQQEIERWQGPAREVRIISLSGFKFSDKDI